MTDRTTGRVFTTPDGKTYRPSMFLTLTCDSYGKVRDGRHPGRPGRYDYQRAARDAIHFPALFDRLIQNLRRYLGYDVQYFAAIEPQKRLAPHAHIAFRGAISRADLRRSSPPPTTRSGGPPPARSGTQDDELPVWHEPSGNYVDPETGEVLPTWDQALDAIGPGDEPLHVARFGPKFDAQGVLAGTRDAARCVRYLTKYLTKQIAGCHTAETDAQRRPRRPARRRSPVRAVLAARARTGSATASSPKTPGPNSSRPLPGQSPPLREPRLRRTPRPGLPQMVRQDPDRPPRRPQSLAYGHARASGNRATTQRYTWERVTPADPDHMPPTQRLMHVLGRPHRLESRSHRSQKPAKRRRRIFRQRERAA